MIKKALPKVPNAVEDTFIEVIEALEKLCNEKLNDEYYDLAVELAAKLARKRPSPLLSGSNTDLGCRNHSCAWHGQFLFDKTQTPYLSLKELCEWFNLVPRQH